MFIIKVPVLMGIIIIFLHLEVFQIVGVPRFWFILTKLIGIYGLTNVICIKLGIYGKK